MQRFTLFLLLFLLCLAGLSQAQEKYTISGYVKDAANGEGLIGATIYVPELATGASTNVYGFYSLTLPKGTHTLTFSYMGYVSRQLALELTANVTIDIQLSEERVEMQEVVVTATKADENVQSMEMSVNRLDVKTIKTMPALLGEVDVIRSIQMLPGVTTVGEGAAGFNVRGGSIDQNLILLDEAPVYNSSHLFGFFSVFNPDAVKDVKLLKGGIPAQYGGRLSSLLDVRMKDGNSKNMSYSGGIGTVSSRFAVEGPLVKDKSSFIIAGRRTYGDIFLKLSPEFKDNQLYFYDLSTKVNYTINDKNRIYLSGYFGRDVFKLGEDASMNWGNATGTFRWNHLFNSRLFSNLTLVYSNYDYLLGVPTGAQAFEWKSNIINYSAKADFSYYLNTSSTFTFGGSSMLYRFKPGKAAPLGSNSVFNPIELDQQHGLEHALYVDHEQHIGSRLVLQYGFRLSAFDYLGSGTVYEYEGENGKRKTPVNPRVFGSRESIKLYANLEPRFAARYTLTESSSLKMSYNRMAQYIHLISNTTASSPLDVWSPSTANIKPELADQVAVGLFKNLKDNMYETSVEAYYKTMTNQIDYVDGADLLLNEDLEADLLYGKGRAYGVEFFAKKNTGRLNGWLSYTLSRTERQIDGINYNKYYAAKYDKTHNLNAVAVYELTKRLNLSGNFVYGTGVATTFPNGRFEQDGLIVPINTDNARNNFRVPAYHRLDLSATLEGKKKPGRKYESSWTFSLYNLYSRRNAFSVYFRQNEDNPQKTEAVRLSVFGSVIPSVTYNFKF
jgi:hypothetical protein